jgi:hypothetical protein
VAGGPALQRIVVLNRCRRRSRACRCRIAGRTNESGSRMGAHVCRGTRARLWLGLRWKPSPNPHGRRRGRRRRRRAFGLSEPRRDGLCLTEGSHGGGRGRGRRRRIRGARRLNKTGTRRLGLWLKTGSCDGRRARLRRDRGRRKSGPRDRSTAAGGRFEAWSGRWSGIPWLRRNTGRGRSARAGGVVRWRRRGSPHGRPGRRGWRPTAGWAPPVVVASSAGSVPVRTMVDPAPRIVGVLGTHVDVAHALRCPVTLGPGPVVASPVPVAVHPSVTVSWRRRAIFRHGGWWWHRRISRSIVVRRDRGTDANRGARSHHATCRAEGNDQGRQPKIPIHGVLLIWVLDDLAGVSIRMPDPIIITPREPGNARSHRPSTCQVPGP